MHAIDLNSDLGEWDASHSEPSQTHPGDAALFGIVTSANVAAGFHAGGAESMLSSARLAAEHNVSLGLHPSYRDREGFGRRDREIDSAILVDDILEQAEALAGAARAVGTRVRYLKPHGALYHRIARDPVQADAVALAAEQAQLPLLGLAGTAIHEAARGRGIPFFAEAFADRAYLPDGTLVPRTREGAVITDPSAVGERALRMATERDVVAVDGSTISLAIDSLCVHGDTPGALALAAAVRASLTGAGVKIRPFA